MAPIGGTLITSRQTVSGRAVRDRETVHIEDLLALPETEFPETLARMRRSPNPFRTMLGTPLLREGVPIGAILMRRGEVQPFTDKQIELAKTFANQAVIAIENVRLFGESRRGRNCDLTEGRRNSRSRSQVESTVARARPELVFQTWKRNISCAADRIFIFRVDGAPGGRALQRVREGGGAGADPDARGDTPCLRAPPERRTVWPPPPRPTLNIPPPLTLTIRRSSRSRCSRRTRW